VGYSDYSRDLRREERDFTADGNRSRFYFAIETKLGRPTIQTPSYILEYNPRFARPLTPELHTQALPVGRKPPVMPYTSGAGYRSHLSDFQLSHGPSCG
jgi:hypothetical protein